MKKLIGVLGGSILVFALVGVAIAAKPTDPCHYVTDKNIPYPSGYYLADQYYMPGYDIFGYNYQAHIFNGSYANAYLNRNNYPPYTGDDALYLSENPSAESTWYWPYRNIQLQMKWNDAWLANNDCGIQNGQANYTDPDTPDNVLDRHYPLDSYRGSGAWLTNHAYGTYEGPNWQLNGDYVLTFMHGGSYVHDMTVTTDPSTGDLTGTGAYPSGGPYTVTWVVNGNISASNVTLDIAYDSSSYTVHAVGTIVSDGTFEGTWTSSTGQNGTWSATSGVASKQCTVSDFVKIVAAPLTAVKDSGFWYTDGTETTVIGSVIWGDFAIIQEQASDPCGEYGVINFFSPLKKGLGNWAY